MKTKRCKICKIRKFVSSFNTARVSKKGVVYLQSYCKECQGKYLKVYWENNKDRLQEIKREWVKNNPERYKAMLQKYLPRKRQQDKKYQRLKRKLNPEIKTKENRAYITKYPERIRANQKLNYNLRMGRVKKLPCVVCGEVKVQGHHPDYSKPLEVIWLCASHHKKVDMGLIKI